MLINIDILQSKALLLQTEEFDRLGRGSVDSIDLERFTSRVKNRDKLIAAFIQLAELVEVDKLNQIEYDI